MGVRPPQQDDDEPDAIEFGIAALDARLSEVDVDYPATGETIIEELGDAKIPYNATGSRISMTEAIDRSDESRFESEQELLNALHPVFEEYRASRGASLVGRLRSLLPF